MTRARDRPRDPAGLHLGRTSSDRHSTIFGLAGAAAGSAPRTVAADWSTSPDRQRRQPDVACWPFSFGEHPFGQDEIGKDIFAHVMRGTQQSIIVMFLVRHRRWHPRRRARCRLGLLPRLDRLAAHALHRRDHHHPDHRHRRRSSAACYGGRAPSSSASSSGSSGWTALARLVRGEFLVAARTRVRRRGARRRSLEPADHLPPHPAERGRRHHRQHDAADERARS